jgi:hypothetical protein
MYDYRYNWLQNLKVGDQVVIRNAQGQTDNDALTTVDKVMKTIIVVGAGGMRFNKNNGREIGCKGQWYCTHLDEATPAKINRLREIHLRRLALGRLEVAITKAPTELLITCCNILGCGDGLCTPNDKKDVVGQPDED